MLFWSDAILPSVNDERSADGVHALGPPVGHQRPLPRDADPHGRWMRRSL